MSPRNARPGSRFWIFLALQAGFAFGCDSEARSRHSSEVALDANFAREASVDAARDAQSTDGGSTIHDAGSTDRRLLVQAIAEECDTDFLDGLSQQIFDEMMCELGSSFASFSDLSPQTARRYPFLQPPAARALRRVFASFGGVPRIESVLRSVAQQLTLFRWGGARRCGIGRVASPGTSNHEQGLAIDIEESVVPRIRSLMERNGFRWLGSTDPVHFDYIGSGTSDWRPANVRAFQRLWNRAHPDDAIREDGAFGPATRDRLERSPVVGFPSHRPCE